ncbi:MAG: SDR family oxidoreductase [Leptonema illini]|uniref:SDR family oxidoreductase n=1 Tax=Leptonema illini TaxID=183 RepID=A0A833H3H2_9LEPT|nr:MAG: SDR family oxidoreductase [Leptonema illini]
MASLKDKNYWALILGGSSGFGLASAKRLAGAGVNICIVHRDRKGAMARIDPEFEAIRATGSQLLTYNLDGLSEEGRKTVLDVLEEAMKGGKVRTLLHSIAFGNLKLMAPIVKHRSDAVAKLAASLGVDAAKLRSEATRLFLEEGVDELMHIAEEPAYNQELFLGDEDIANTIYAMGTSLATWTAALFQRKMFASDARVLGLTSEGNETAWRGYAAVSAAKVALEAISRSIAYEYGPHGIRSNILQPGVTDTPALRLIPGSTHMAAHSRMRNPLGRLTTPEDVGAVVLAMSLDETAWINGEIIRVDGGERIAG